MYQCSRFCASPWRRLKGKAPQLQQGPRGGYRDWFSRQILRNLRRFYAKPTRGSVLGPYYNRDRFVQRKTIMKDRVLASLK
jgi:hypothetical protein